MAANETDGPDGVGPIDDRTRMIEGVREELRLVSEVEEVLTEAERDERELRIAFLNSMPRSTPDVAPVAAAGKFPDTCPGAIGYGFDVELPDWFLDPFPTLRSLGSPRRRTSVPKPTAVA